MLIPFWFLQVGENFVPPLLDAVLIDYQRNVPAAREPEVLSTMATIVNKLGGHITSEIPQIFDAVFECTLNMINKVSGPHGPAVQNQHHWWLTLFQAGEAVKLCCSSEMQQLKGGLTGSPSRVS